ncbi:amino acid adenylation domain-containing protein [Microbispora amethystogenes]
MSDDKPMPLNAVAVVGMALRVPGARTLAGFWDNLRKGEESITTYSEDELLAAGVRPDELADAAYVPAMGALDDVAGFDAAFFGFAPREAQLLDPQHRLFLECAWEALEHAGRPSEATQAVTGVYAGVGESSYLLHNLLPQPGLVERIGAYQTSIGNDKDFVPTRVSYKLNLHGPSVSVQTGCSTSLVAVHMACQALISGECDLALAGGATVVAAQDRGYRFEQGGILSPDGHCRAFDVAAAGTVPASGVGVVVLKLLRDAVADGDVIHAVIRGSAINNDGARKVGFTAPSVEGQADVITEALSVAEVDPDTITYVEAHGTGTPLGDPIEVAALRSVFAGARQEHRCALGSVKTNIGHLDTAAGVIGLIKTVLAMRARELPPSLHFTAPNPRLGLDDGPFYVNASLTSWPAEVLRAGVSSFGIGGTNAHVVLEEAPSRPPADAAHRTHVLPISAATPGALGTAATQLAAHLRTHPRERLDEVAYTLQHGRWRLPYRRFVVADTLTAAIAALEGPAPAVVHETGKDRQVAFTFPGQGAQRVDMGLGLYAQEPVFRAQVDRAAEILRPILREDLRSVLYPAEADREQARETVNQTRYAQLVLFVVEYALAKLWMSWGIRPAAMLGHSAGELVAACLAGVMSLENALALIAARGRLMQEAVSGAMLAVPLPESETTELLGADLALAAVNGPLECVVSGPVGAVEDLEARLAAQGVTSTRLRTSHAFHSPLMDRAAEAFAAEVSRVRLAAPDIPFVSNVTGTWITDEEATNPVYWARQLRATVRFHDGLTTLRSSEALLLEVGPGRVLTSLSRTGGDAGAAIASQPSPDDGSSAHVQLLTAAGELWCHGASLDWEALHASAPRRTVLPGYPFERRRCWIDPPRGGTVEVPGQSELTVRGFRRVGPAARRHGAPSPGTWLVVTDRAGVLDDLVERLRATRTRVVTVAEDVLGAGLGRLLAADERVVGVVYGTLLGDGETDVPHAALEELGHALDARGDGDARLIVVASGVLDVTGAEHLQPARSALAAWADAGRPGTRTLLDVVVPDTAASARRLTAALLAEIDAEQAEATVALRAGHRFRPSLEPLRSLAPTDRHSGACYALFGDQHLAAAFGRALTREGATVSQLFDEQPSSVTALILLDQNAPQADLLQTLTRASTLVEALPPGGVRGCEVHLVTAAAWPVVDAHVALIQRETSIAWTSVAWPHSDAASIEGAVARVVRAAPGPCHVQVASLFGGEEDVDLPVSADEAVHTVSYEDDTQREVAAIICDLLGVRDLDPNVGFFEIGGHSLLAAQFVAQLRKIHGVELPLRDFVADPTVRGLACAVRAARDRAGDAELEELPTIVPDPASEGTPFPLTDLQQAYLIGRTGVFELGNVGMHGYDEFDIPDLDLPRMQRALRRLIRRHGMLRAIVLPHGEQQILSEVPDYVITSEDVRGLSEQEALVVAQRTRAAMSHQVFVPDRWPLFEMRATVMDDRTRLHFSMDGLITDAWASNLLMSELAQLYLNPDAELPHIELSFRDYLLAERKLEESGRYRRAEAYWQQRIPTLAPTPELPLALDPRTIAAPRFVRTAGQLPREAWARVKAWASRRGITPTVLMLAVYSEALATWSKHRRFTLNLPMANRLPLHQDVNAIVGDFTSLTLLEIDAANGDSLEARARTVRDQLAADLDHRLYNGVRVLREIKRARGDAAAQMPAVFTSLFLDNGEYTQLGETVYGISQTPQVWIDAQVYELDGALALDIDSVVGLFPEGMVEAVHAACLDLLRWLAEEEMRWSIPFPSLVPRAELTARTTYNQTAGPLPAGLLHEPFFAIAARMPERPAVITPSRTMCYGELAARARAVAARLNVHPNDLVAVIMEKGWEQCVAVLGVLAAGGAYLPIDPDLPDERIQFLLEHGRVRTVLTQSAVAEGRADRFGTKRDVVNVDTLPFAPAATAGPVATTPSDLAYVIFTSGSTGLPKGVMIDHRGALNTVADINDRFGVDERDRVLALSSLSFDLSVYDIFGPLSAGGALVMPDAAAHRDPAAWLDLLVPHRVSIWNSVPALMGLLVEHLGQTTAAEAALRLVMLSGDWIPVTLPDRIRQAFGTPDIISLGGATEASIWSILYPIGDVPADWVSIPYGRPMRNQTFHVLDDSLRPRPDWVPGQMYIGGVGLAQGYLHDEAKTGAAFIVHPETGERLYRTGDLGRFLPSGDIEFLGREDFQVKVQGYRIELGEIEAALGQHPGIKAAVVVAQGEPRGAKRLVAFVVPDGGSEPPEDLRDYLGAKLPSYMVPLAFLSMDTLPLTSNGKVDRRALVVPESLAEERGPAYTVPRTQIEETVADVWSELLQLERVGAHDDFFLLGGDSLMAMRAVVHLRRAFELDLPIRLIFDHPSVAGTALVIEDRLLSEFEEMPEEEAQKLLSS